MKKYKILQMVFALFFFNTSYGQNGFVNPGAGNTSVPITVHDLGTLANGLYLGHGAGAQIASTAVGTGALTSNSTGNSNTAIGFAALQANTTNSNNTAVGVQALTANVGGHENTALGHWSMLGMVSGWNNTALGQGALHTNTGGFSNTAVGLGALGNGALGNENTCMGVNSGLSITGVNSDRNVSVGVGALNSTNSAIGAAYGNVALGFSALNGLSAGTNNIAIGFQTNVGANVNHSLSIQNVIYGMAMNLPASGRIGIGFMPSQVGGGSVVAAGCTTKLHVGGSGTGTIIPSLQLDYVPPGTNTQNNYLFVDPTGVVAQATLPGAVTYCTTVGNIPVTNSTGGDMNCSQINDDNVNVGIGLGGTATTAKLDIDCTSNGANGLIRFQHLAGNPGGNKSILIIDPNGYVYRGIANISKGTGGNSPDAIDLLASIENQALEIATLKSAISELKNKMNQLVPGCVTVKADNFQITPNPVTGTSTVSYKIDAAITNAVFIVYDLQGKMIRKYSVDKNAKEGQVQISKKDFENGMYILSLVANNQEIQSKHFIISE